MPTASGANDIPLGERRRPLGSTTTDGLKSDLSNSSRKSSRRDRSRDRRRSRSPRRRSRERRSRSRSKEKRRSRFDPTVSKLAIAPGPAVLVPNPAEMQIAKPEDVGKEVQKKDGADRKRKSRWASDKSKAFVPGMPTMLPADVNEQQLKQYLLQLEVEDASRRLRTGDLGIPADPAERSPSPEPVYDMMGRRTNTREQRIRQSLEIKRYKGVLELQKINPDYKPPADFRPPSSRLSTKVPIPVEDFPDINFMGLLIGPRGNTLKALEKETGAKIIIRGRGSQKDGLIKPNMPMPGHDEPMHAFITGITPDQIDDAAKKIQDLIDQACAAPESYLEMRKIQLRELAMLNGQLTAADVMGGARCENCGMNTHRTWECPSAQNVTAQIICNLCGGFGHLSKDCKNPTAGGVQLDEEYQALMSELGEAQPVRSNPPPGPKPPAGPPAEGTLQANAAANPLGAEHGQVFVPRTPAGPPGYGYGRSYQPPPQAQTLVPASPWAAPAGGWAMPPGMQQQTPPQQWPPTTGVPGLAPPPGPPAPDFSSLLAPPPPPSE